MSDLSPIVQAFLSQQLLLALVISLAIIPLLKKPARLIGLIDHPGGRKQHQITTSLVGGPAIILASTTSIFIWGLPEGFEGMVCATIGLFIIGFIDDLHDISATFRLIVQAFLVGGALWIDSVWLTDIAITDNIALQLNVFTYPLTILVILGIKNAINMLDGLDGLSSGIVLIILSFLISVSVLSNSPQITSIGVILFGSVLGFWAYNYRFSWREKAPVFMGDSGTTILGFILPYLAIKLSISAPLVASKPLILWLFAIPIWDICAVVVKRVKDGKSPMSAGRDHIHHVLMNSGLEVRQTLHLIYLLCITTSSFGVMILYFGLTQLEVYAIFTIFMLVYLGRVGSLSRKAKSVDAIGEKEPTVINIASAKK